MGMMEFSSKTTRLNDLTELSNCATLNVKMQESRPKGIDKVPWIDNGYGKDAMGG